MFHSGQVFDITCEGGGLPDIIRLAFKLYGDDMFTRVDGRVRVAISEPVPGVYAIGCGSMAEITSGPNARRKCSTPAGWEDIPCAYDPDILAIMLKQWLARNPLGAETQPMCDGTVRLGFRVRSLGSAWDKIPGLSEQPGWNPNEAILIITPHWITYYK